MEQSTHRGTPARKPKTIHSLDIPYSSAQWHADDFSQQPSRYTGSAFLLSQIGDHRRQHIEPSKGKRHRKRKRESEGEIQSTTGNDQQNPAYPSIQKYLTVGFNSTNRHLESLAKPPSKNEEGDTTHDEVPCMPVLFVPRSDQPSIMNGHLPLLVRMASIGSPTKPPVRLVTLPKGAEARLSASLGTPRVGLVGILEDAPGADGLVKLVRELVPAVEVPWLKEAALGEYMPVNIKAIETSAPVLVKGKKPKESKAGVQG